MDKRFRRHFKSISDNEVWEQYSVRLAITKEPAERYFFEHVIFEHYDDFIRRFPWFQFEDFNFGFENWTAEKIHGEVRYDTGEDIDFWYHHLESDKRFCLSAQMENTHTWPMPPAVFVFSNSFSLKDKANLTSVHLVEGTHRVSYLKKYLLNGFIAPQSQHQLLVLRNKGGTGLNALV
jgi:hypothetical protein